MSDIRVQITEDNSKDIKEKIAKAIDLALEEIGGEAMGFATMICPTDTGLLKNSITYAVHGKGPKSSTYVADNPDKNGNLRSGSYSGNAPDEDACVFVGTNVSYAAYVEMGSSARRNPKPYLKPAVQDHKDLYREIFEKHMKDA